MFLTYNYPVKTKLVLYRRLRNAAVIKKVHDLLIRHNPFYKLLSVHEQKKFISRTIKIEAYKRFVPRENLEIDFRHRILISSVITQLTFGIARNYDLPRFNLIQIYPETFYSGIFDAHAKGLTFSSGRILMSWLHFDHGMQHTHDNIHLGLHEFAHAMMLQFDNFSTSMYWKKWQREAEVAMQITANSENSFFRKYGSTNIQEFWAVSVETFFESPLQFKSLFPALYSYTSKMLSQDMAQRINHQSNVAQ